MEVENMKKAILAYEASKFENILELCNSFIEKKFLGYLYYFFKVNDFHPYYEMISPGDIDRWNDVKLSSIWNYIKSHPNKFLNYKFIKNPEIGEKHILCGFSVKCYDVIYRFFPQFPIYDISKIIFKSFPSINISRKKVINQSFKNCTQYG